MRNELEISSLSAITHILSNRPDRIHRLMFHTPVNKLPQRLSEILEQAKAHNVPVAFRDKNGGGEPLTAYLHSFHYTDFAELVSAVEKAQHSLVLALDHLQDPQNFGALCRTAEALGVTGIIIPKDRGVVVTAGVYHASAGAVETIPVVLVNNLGEALRRLKDNEMWLVGASLGESATSIAEVPDFKKIVLVLGTELEGLSQQIEKNCDWRIRIPLPGKVHSLNVSAAGAILMYTLMNRLRS